VNFTFFQGRCAKTGVTARLIFLSSSSGQGNRNSFRRFWLKALILLCLRYFALLALHPDVAADISVERLEPSLHLVFYVTLPILAFKASEDRCPSSRAALRQLSLTRLQFWSRPRLAARRGGQRARNNFLDGRLDLTCKAFSFFVDGARGLERADLSAPSRPELVLPSNALARLGKILALSFFFFPLEPSFSTFGPRNF